MTTKRLRWFVLIVAITLAVTLSFHRLTAAQGGSIASEGGSLGYSEAPFELIENADEATGTTALESVRAASADDKPIVLDRIVVEGDYALLSVTYNYIGVSAISKRQGSRWQFVCRAGGLMQPEELTGRCEVPSATAESLYIDFLEAP